MNTNPLPPATPGAGGGDPRNPWRTRLASLTPEAVKEEIQNQVDQSDPASVKTLEDPASEEPESTT